MTTRRNAVWVLLVLVSLGCSARQDSGMGAAVTGSTNPGSPTTPSAATTITDLADDRDAASDGYRRFWVVAYTLDAHPVAEWSRRLGTVTTEPLLPKLLDALRAQHASGIREYGRVLPRLVTVEIHGDVATIFDCQDASGAGEAHTTPDCRRPSVTPARRSPPRCAAVPMATGG